VRLPPSRAPSDRYGQRRQYKETSKYESAEALAAKLQKLFKIKRREFIDRVRGDPLLLNPPDLPLAIGNGDSWTPDSSMRDDLR